MAGAEYPKGMYRPGHSLKVWNLYDVDYRVVDDPDEQRQAEAQGWSSTPEPQPEPSEPVWGDHDADGRTGGSLSGSRSTRAIGKRRKRRK